MLTVRLVRAGELSADTAQTPHLMRFAAVSERTTGSEHIWMGLSVLPPGHRTGVHHHGSSETAVYVVRGVGRWWVGEELDEPIEAGPGDFIFIPPETLHWEENASEVEPVEMVVSRSTQEAIVVNVPTRSGGPDGP